MATIVTLTVKADARLKGATVEATVVAGDTRPGGKSPAVVENGSLGQTPARRSCKTKRVSYGPISVFRDRGQQWSRP